MEMSFLSTWRVLIVPGLNGSGPEHWQSRWQRLCPSMERVEQDRWDVPHLPTWSVRLGQVLQTSNRPTLLVAHSFGCLATVHCAEVGNIAGALLVAPADPEKFGVEHVLRGVRLRFPSIVVGSRNDPWMNSTRARIWANRWGSEFIDAGELGHINAESGLQDWPFGLTLLQELAGMAGRHAQQQSTFSSSASTNNPAF